MVNPLPSNYGITTPYGKRGSSWSCGEDSSGKGIHTGADFAAPVGTPVYACIAGDIRWRSYGSAFGSHQFAISPDSGEPYGAGEVFYAHTRTRLADGTRVEVGQRIAEVGTEGNVTGPHLHLEFHPSTKGVWSCAVHADPAPVIAHGGGSTDSPWSAGPVYEEKLHYGQRDSDSVRRLQYVLNGISLDGGSELTIDGDYGDATDREVRLWQEQICHDPPDPAGESFLGPEQTAAMFDEPPYQIL